MKLFLLSITCVSSLVLSDELKNFKYGAEPGGDKKGPQAAEGYYVFVESPNAEPPRVRPPPYTFSNYDCNEASADFHHVRKPQHGSISNLCGDLNKGSIPKNPMGQNVMDSAYPFELIRNMTLKYLSRTLPILKADDTLPKVTQMQEDVAVDVETSLNTISRQRRETEDDDGRHGKKFCDQGGVLCMIYNAINKEGSTTQPRVPSSNPVHAESREDAPVPPPTMPKYEGPPTPCPAKVEYATPVFAKNYQGVWRYVVQIPYEGYFTQTVEITRCLQARCHYLDGGCLSSPRWSSLLVAEIYYPETVVSNSENADSVGVARNSGGPPSVQDFQNYQQYLHKRAGTLESTTSSTKPQVHCDGIDTLGCFQVRLYYDWFLIPGSCKCWRPDYFNKYVRRKSVASPEL